MSQASKTWNGTFARVFIDGIEALLLSSITTRDEIEYEDIPQPGKLRDGKKMVKVGGTGEMTVKVANKNLVRDLAARLDQGHQPEVEIQATQDDPASDDALYMAFNNCAIEGLDYIVATSHEVSEETFSFSYTDRKFLN